MSFGDSHVFFQNDLGKDLGTECWMACLVVARLAFSPRPSALFAISAFHSFRHCADSAHSVPLGGERLPEADLDRPAAVLRAAHRARPGAGVVVQLVGRFRRSGRDSRLGDPHWRERHVSTRISIRLISLGRLGGPRAVALNLAAAAGIALVAAGLVALTGTPPQWIALGLGCYCAVS